MQWVYWRKFTGRSPIGESARGLLAKVHWTFANWRKCKGYIGESSVEIRQLAKVQGIYWRKFTGNSPIGESTGGILAKVHWTFANGESPVCENPIGELPVTQKFFYFLGVGVFKSIYILLYLYDINKEIIEISVITENSR